MNASRQAESTVLQQTMAGARLSLLGEDVGEVQMEDMTVKVSRGIGWLLFLGGLLMLAGFGIYEFVIDTSMDLFFKLLVSAVYMGLGALFVSVLSCWRLARQ